MAKTIEMVELQVTVENHTHSGKLCSVGDVIKVSPECKKTMEAAWKRAAEVKKTAGSK
jgi:hypothetical protein